MQHFVILDLNMGVTEQAKMCPPGGQVEYANGTKAPLDDGNDLWWATLGGGGSTFGVVTSLKMALHGPPTTGFIEMRLTVPIQSEGACAGVASKVRRPQQPWCRTSTLVLPSFHLIPFLGTLHQLMVIFYVSIALCVFVPLEMSLGKVILSSKTPCRACI